MADGKRPDTLSDGLNTQHRGIEGKSAQEQSTPLQGNASVHSDIACVGQELFLPRRCPTT